MRVYRNSLKRLLALVALLCVGCPIGLCQSVDEAAETLLLEEASDADVSNLVDLIEQYAAEPLNLNDTATIRDFPLLSPFQQKALCNYILLYGQLLSTAELYAVPGFDSLTVASILPYVTVSPLPEAEGWHLSEGRHTLVTGVGGNVERAAGYDNGNYDGDALRALLCYTYDYRNRLTIRLVADKDPAEAWGKGNYYSYHLMLNDVGCLRRLVVGRYNLQFGQGLTLWTGLRPFSFLGSSAMRFGTGVKAAGTFYESGYQEGVATTVGLGGGVELTGFASYTGGTTLFGGHVEYRRGNLVAGTTVAYTMLDEAASPADYVYNERYFRGSRLLDVGVDAMYQWRRLTMYGEVAMDGQADGAVVAGLDVQATSTSRIGINLRHFAPLYHNLHADAYSIGTTQAESGVAIDATLRLPLALQALISADVHRFPTPRYGSYTPSSGSWLRAQIGRPLGRRASVSLRYTYRLKERNIPGSAAVPYEWEQTVRWQLQADARLERGSWRWAARWCRAEFASESAGVQRGWLVYAQTDYKAAHTSLAAGLAWFDVDGYYARLYLAEHTMQYAWSMPSLTGRGLRGHLMVQLPLGEHLVLAARYAATYLPGQDAIGSGDARTEGPLRQTWHLQCRLKF